MITEALTHVCHQNIEAEASHNDCNEMESQWGVNWTGE